jgi:DMSO/TMAO reductase YedYZ molybdopterin-dependent catalytic subunit
MRRISLFMGALVGGFTSLALMALWYLGDQLLGLPFVPFDAFDWLARNLPGNVITLAIDTIVRVITTFNLGATSPTAKLIEQLLGLGQVLAGGVVLGIVVAWLLRNSSWSGWQVGSLVGMVVFLATTFIEFNLGIKGSPGLAVVWLAISIFGWTVLVGRLLDRKPSVREAEDTFDAGRRAALIKIAGGSAGVALGAWALGRVLANQVAATGAGQPLASITTATPQPGPTSPPPTATGTAVAGATPAPAAAATPALTPTAMATMRERVQPAPGTRPELTSNQDFYRIDIDTRPPVIEEATWKLEVAGLFDNPRTLTLSDLLAYPAVTQPITLSCISNPIGGSLIGTSNWTGARLRDVLKDLGLRPEAKELAIKAVDGFYESVAMEDLMDPRTLLVYGMNGDTLPVPHGFPLRIYIPNRYGMKQPKWITHIEAINKEGAGYWVDRSWSKEARPQIVSVIDIVAVDQAVDGKIPVGGIAWAGDRGIQKVEVQVDDAEWVEAELRTPPLGPLTWVQWRYDWPMSSGRHSFQVRATDGTGTLQTEQMSDPHPNGATGYDMMTVNV